MSAEHHLEEEDHDQKGLDLSLWTRLFAYARAYPRQVWLLTMNAVLVAGVETCFPLVTKFLLDDITGWIRALGKHRGHESGACPVKVALERG